MNSTARRMLHLATVLTTTAAFGLGATDVARGSTKRTTTTTTPTTTLVPELAGGHRVTASATVDPSQVTSPGEQCVASGVGDALVQKGVCARSGLVNVVLNGDISGPTVWASASFFVPSNGNNGFSGMLVMENATVAGCGTGTIVISFGPSTIGTKNPNGTSLFPGYWRITSTSGSSPLARLQGEGLIWADSLTAPGPLSMHMSGIVRC